MNVSIQETSPTIRTLSVQMAQSDLAPSFEKKVAQYRKDVNMKGFRPGQVPRAMILQRFGDMIRQEAMDDTINQVIREEISKAGLQPVARGQLQNFKDEKPGDISFEVVLEVDPPIEVKDYLNLGISMPEVIVADFEVQEEMQRMRRMWAQENDVERPADKGDLVVGRYLEVMIDGEVRPLPEDPQFRSVVGDSTTPGFDDGLLGMSKGEEKAILFVYGHDHSDAEFAGKSARFTVVIDQVREITMPEMDEEFYKQVGAENEQDLREKITDGLLFNKRRQARRVAHEQALDALIAKTPFEVPQARIKHWVSHTVNKNEHHDGEEDLPDPTPEQMQELAPKAEREIRKYRILESIVEQEKIKPSQAMVDARIQEIANAYQVDFESIKAHFRQSGRIVHLREEIKFEMALDKVIEPTKAVE